MQRVSRRLVHVVLFSLLLAASAQAGFTTYRGKVLKVVDGDTIRFLPDNAPDDGGKAFWSIRMISTDTAATHLPGKGGPYSQGYWGEQGHDQLAAIVAVGETVEVDDYGTDHYGRHLGRVFKRGNVDVNLEMVKSGWASLYVICDDKSCDENVQYREACDNAMARGLGIFNPENRLPLLPFIFRSIHQNRPLAKLVGNVRTKRYYAPTEYGKVPLCDRTFFMTPTDARREGYTPAN